MAFRWDRPALMIFHPELSLFLSWNDETGQIMYMNSDKLEWAWSPIEFVGTTAVGTAVDAATAGSMLVALMARIEAGEVVVLDRSDSVPERDIRRWVGPEWSDPLENQRAEGIASYEAWRQRCLALGSLSQVEVLDLVASLQ
jgi:hypothetical protein